MRFSQPTGRFRPARRRVSIERRSRYWFATKRWGWGWTPVSREGWIVTIAAIALYVPLFLQAMRSLDAGDTVAFSSWLAAAIAVLAALLIVCYRTGERPHWRWG